VEHRETATSVADSELFTKTAATQQTIFV